MLGLLPWRIAKDGESQLHLCITASILAVPENTEQGLVGREEVELMVLFFAVSCDGSHDGYVG